MQCETEYDIIEHFWTKFLTGAIFDGFQRSTTFNVVRHLRKATTQSRIQFVPDMLYKELR